MRRILSAAAVACALAGVAAGCGSVGDKGGGSGGGGGGGGDSKTVKIGMSSILSGPAASAGVGTDAGLKAYLRHVNAQGGINGYRFTFDELDNAYDPAKAASTARQLVNDGVFAMVSEGTEPLKAMVPITDPAGIPSFTESSGEIVTPPSGQYKHVYGINPSYHSLCYEATNFIMQKLHARTAALAYLDNDGETMARSAFPASFKAHGGKVTAIEAVQTTTTDYSPMAQRLKQSGAPVVYAFLLDSQLPGLQKAAAAIGYHPKWVTWFQPYSPGYVQLAGKLANGLYISEYATPLTNKSDPQVKQYLSVMGQFSPKNIDSVAAEQGWTFGAAIARGVKDATAGGKKLTADSFEQALGSLDDESLGLVPSITYDDTTHVGATKSAFYVRTPAGALKALTPYATLPTKP